MSCYDHCSLIFNTVEDPIPHRVEGSKLRADEEEEGKQSKASLQEEDGSLSHVFSEPKAVSIHCGEINSYRPPFTC